MLSTILLSLATLTSCSYIHDAWVDIVPGGDQIGGNLKLFQHGFGVTITGTVHGLTEGLHGFHVHEKGDLGNGCKAAGGHFNPFKQNHGGPKDEVRHVGDLGNIEAHNDGVAHISIIDSFISLDPNSQAYIGGLAFVIHAGEDDLGRGGNEDSLKTGNAGSRSGCGIIKVNPQTILFPQLPWPVPQQPQLVYRPPQIVHQLPQPVYHRPQPVYHQPQPVYHQPQPVPSHYRPGNPPRAHSCSRHGFY